jgi:hypothetical protein
VCKEGATPWASLKARQSATAANVSTAHHSVGEGSRAGEAVEGHGAGAPSDAADVGGKPAHRQAPAADWVPDKGIGRHRDSEKVHLDVYEDGQSADALDGIDSAAATSNIRVPSASTLPTAHVVHARSDAVSKPAHAHVGRHKTSSKAGKSKSQAKKVVTF